MLQNFKLDKLLLDMPATNATREPSLFEMKCWKKAFSVRNIKSETLFK